MINKAHASHPSSSPIRSGFTIVELLIVIVVIAILAAISIIAYTGIQGRAKDTQRLQDMSTIVRALEAYKIVNGRYPSQVGTPDAGGWEITSDGTSATNFLSILKSNQTGITTVPVDPTNSTVSGTVGSGFRSPHRSFNNWVYFYAYYAAGTSGCDSARGQFYVLGATRMDGVPIGQGHPQSPGWSCPSRDWAVTGAWVTGRFTN